MIVECKKCKSLFRLDEGLLREEGSKLRCSVCKHVFIAYPAGLEPLEEEKPRPTDQSLGETVTLESRPVLDEEEREPLLEDVSEEDFEAAFEEEPETKRIQAISPDQIPEEEEEEEFHLEMDYEEKQTVKPEPAPVAKRAAAGPRRVERKPEPPARAAMEVRPKAKKARRSKLPLVLLVILLLLIGGAAAVVRFAPELVPEQLAFLKATHRPESKDPGVLRLRFTAVTGSFVQNSKAGQLFVIRGTISNTYPDSRSYVLVKGSILDDSGKVVKTKVAYAGNAFTDGELKDLSVDEINQGLRNKAGKGNINENIKPQASVPFMIVFEELPENLSEFTVEPVSSSPGR